MEKLQANNATLKFALWATSSSRIVRKMLLHETENKSERRTILY